MYYLFKYWISTIYFCSLSIICRIIRIPNSSEAEKLNMQCSQLVILKKKKGIVNVSGKLLVDLPTQYKWLHISFHPFIAIDDSSSRLPRSNVMFPNFFQQRYVQHKNQEMFLSLYLYHYNLDIWMFFLIWRNHFVFLIGN